jgi:hypothetical protein
MYFRHAVLRDAEGSAGGGGSAADSGQSAGFDPAAFRAELLADLRKDLNGITKSLKGDITKSLKELLSAQSQGTGASDSNAGNSGNNGGGTDGGQTSTSSAIPPEINARLQAAERQTKALTDKLAEQEARATKAEQEKREGERKSAIRSALADFPFKDKASQDFAFRALAQDIVYDEDGNLIANTDKGAIPYADHIKLTVDGLPGLLAPKGTGGAGARPGAKSGSAWRPSVDDDFTKYTPEQMKIAEAEILRAMAQAQNGNLSA